MSKFRRKMVSLEGLSKDYCLSSSVMTHFGCLLQSIKPEPWRGLNKDLPGWETPVSPVQDMGREVIYGKFKS